ncbi:hypothetical protein OG225_42975 (plasmid) [Nocardia sp. NBC_01377]|uniref:biotin/lipoyl-containing protein n=1 Tax=Nocardia sp. NBC_01377 TaxID=2903595 RepID=UPI00324E9A98
MGVEDAMLTAGTKDEFGILMRTMMRSAGLTPYRLEKLTGFPKSTTSSWIQHGERPFPRRDKEEHVTALFEACGCSPAQVQQVLRVWRSLRDGAPLQPAEPRIDQSEDPAIIGGGAKPLEPVTSSPVVAVVESAGARTGALAGLMDWLVPSSAVLVLVFLVAVFVVDSGLWAGWEIAGRPRPVISALIMVAMVGVVGSLARRGERLITASRATGELHGGPPGLPSAGTGEELSQVQARDSPRVTDVVDISASVVADVVVAGEDTPAVGTDEVPQRSPGLDALAQALDRVGSGYSDTLTQEGFVLWMFQNVGFTLRRNLGLAGDRVATDTLMPGDIVKSSDHEVGFGLYAGEGNIVHLSPERDVVISLLNARAAVDCWRIRPYLPGPLIRLPRINDSVGVRVDRWLAQVGDEIGGGEPIVRIVCSNGEKRTLFLPPGMVAVFKQIAAPTSSCVWTDHILGVIDEVRCADVEVRSAAITLVPDYMDALFAQVEPRTDEATTDDIADVPCVSMRADRHAEELDTSSRWVVNWRSIQERGPARSTPADRENGDKPAVFTEVHPEADVAAGAVRAEPVRRPADVAASDTRKADPGDPRFKPGPGWGVTGEQTGSQGAAMDKMITVPRLNRAAVDGSLTRWLVREGDSVEVDELIAVVRTAGFDLVLRSPGRGIVKILVSEGGVASGDVVGVVGTTYAPRMDIA